MSKRLSYQDRTLRSPVVGFAASLLTFAVAVLAVLWPAERAWADVSVSASISPQRAQVGQTVALSIEVQGAQSVDAPSIDVDGFDGRYVGPSTQVSIVNGQMSASVTHRYALVPLREGVFTLGPFKLDYQGQQYTTNQVQIAVSAAADRATGGAAGGKRGDSLRAQLSVRSGDVYLHERLPVEVTLYVRSTQVADIQFPTLSADGFSVESFPQPDRGVEEFEGTRYEALHFRTFAVPLQPGTRTLGPATVHLNVITQGGNFFFAQKRPMDVQSNAATVNVLPLPEEGKPAGFAGAVGQFELDVSAAPTELAVGDPVTVKMVVRGQGNLTDAQPPKLSSSEGFRAYDAQPSKDEATGTRAFEQVLIPESDKVQAVPPVRFSYFDTQQRQYRTLSSAPIALTVRPRADNASSQIVAAPGQPRAAAPEKLGRDIVYIKDDPGELRPISAPWYGSRLIWLWLPVPIVLLLAAVAYDRRRERLSGDLSYARFSRAGGEARSALAAASAALADQRVGECYDHLSRAVREYIAAKLDVPVGTVSAELLARRGVSDHTVQEARKFFETFEHSRYTGRADATVAATLLSSAQAVVDQLERERGLRKRH